MIIDLSLNNEKLYQGCEIEVVTGRKNLKTPVISAVDIVGVNINKMLDEGIDKNEIILSGPMAIWAYLVVFHTVVHKTTSVFYDDGRGGKILIAKHG